MKKKKVEKSFITVVVFCFIILSFFIYLVTLQFSNKKREYNKCVNGKLYYQQDGTWHKWIVENTFIDCIEEKELE